MSLDVTPTISDHARQRCAEMGLSTKVAKRAWRHQSMTRPDPQGNPNRVFVSSNAEPKVALIVDTSGHIPQVVTVLWYSYTPFVRSKAA